MRKILFAACLLMAMVSGGQNIGFGTNQPQTIIDLNGDFALRSTSLVLGNGTLNAVNVGAKFSSFRITGPTAPFTIAGLTPGLEGKLVTLFNRSGQSMTIANDAASANANARIITGTGASVIIPHNASIQFQFDNTVGRWVVRNHSAPISGGGSSAGWSTNFDHIYNTNTLNVGIGTLWPQYKLHVNGQGHFYQAAPVSFSPGEQGGHYFNGGGLSVSSQNLDNFPAGIENNHLSFDGRRIQAFVRRVDDGSVSDYAGSVVLNPIDGNVGIGTNYAPNRKLEIYKGRILFTGAQDPANFVYGGIEFTNAAANSMRGFVGMANDELIGFYGFTGGGYGLLMNVSTGNVSIGTVTGATGYKLSVGGKIMAEEIRVQSMAAWPDYVFKKEYRLPTLSELEKHIATHGHLPNIPDAKTIDKEGIKLGDMQTRMMEKIEELTLYIIQMDKDNRLLRQELDVLKASIKK
jgi:hypothetical protein